MKIKRKKRVDFKIGLQVDTVNKQHEPTIFRTDSRLDFLENPDAKGSITIKFCINDFSAGLGSPAHLVLVGTSQDNGAAAREGWFISVNKDNGTIYYSRGTTGTPNTYILSYSQPNSIKLNQVYTLTVTLDLSINSVRMNLSGTNLLVTTDLTGKPDIPKKPVKLGGFNIDFSQSKGVKTVYGLAFCNHEADRKTGASFLGYIEGMNNVGNWIHKDLHPYCVGDYPFQEKSGAVAYDYVEQYHYAQNYGAIEGDNLDTGYILTQGNDFFLEFDGFIADTYNYHILTNTESGAGLRFAIYNNKLGGTSAGVEDAYVSYSIPLNAWHKYKIEVKSDNLLYLYVDGDLKGTANFGTMNASGTTMRLLFGVLSGNKYSNIKFVVSGATVFQYKCNELSGSVLYDSSGNNRNINNIILNNVRKSGIYQKLKGNHCELIGYDPAEVAPNGSARKDIKTKATAINFDGSGNEIASGLPEIKNALKILNSAGDYFEVGGEFMQSIPISSHLTGIGTGNFGLLYMFENSTFTADSRTIYFRSGGFHFTVFKDRIQGYTNVSEDSGIHFDYNELLSGINTIYTQRTGLFTYELFVNGRKVLNYQQPSGTAGTLAGLHTINLPNYNYNAIVFGVFSGVKDNRQVLELHKNSRLGNPMNLDNWKCYYQLGNIKNGNEVEDLTGLNGNIILSNFTANQLNPTHQDFAVVPLNLQRLGFGQNTIPIIRNIDGEYIGFNGYDAERLVSKLKEESLWNSAVSVLSGDSFFKPKQDAIQALYDYKAFVYQGRAGNNGVQDGRISGNKIILDYERHFRGVPSGIASLAAGQGTVLTYFFSFKYVGSMSLFAVESVGYENMFHAEHYGIGLTSSLISVHNGLGPISSAHGQSLSVGQNIVLAVQHNGNTDWNFYLNDLDSGVVSRSNFGVPLGLVVGLASSDAGGGQFRSVFRDFIAISGNVTRAQITSISNFLKNRINGN